MTAHSAALIEQWRGRAERALERALSPPPSDFCAVRRLHEAMRYAALGGGKRIRPLLIYAVGHVLGVAPTRLDAPASAVELIHAYSLIHDDLPAMDDGDLRRGRPACHRAFGEALAILAGDALQALAFATLAAGQFAPAQGVRMVAALAEGAGMAGMAGGQAMDLQADGAHADEADLEAMHLRKTGALICAGARLGALAADADGAALETFARYGRAVGLAFQIRDDILDVEGDDALLGKPRGADAASDKATFVRLLGIEGARRRAAQLHQEALEALERFDRRADPLRELAGRIVRRAH